MNSVSIKRLLVSDNAADFYDLNPVSESLQLITDVSAEERIKYAPTDSDAFNAHSVRLNGDIVTTLNNGIATRMMLKRALCPNAAIVQPTITTYAANASPVQVTAGSYFANSVGKVYAALISGTLSPSLLNSLEESQLIQAGIPCRYIGQISQSFYRLSGTSSQTLDTSSSLSFMKVFTTKDGSDTYILYTGAAISSTQLSLSAGSTARVQYSVLPQSAGIYENAAGHGLNVLDDPSVFAVSGSTNVFFNGIAQANCSDFSIELGNGLTTEYRQSRFPTVLQGIKTIKGTVTCWFTETELASFIDSFNSAPILELADGLKFITVDYGLVLSLALTAPVVLIFKETPSVTRQSISKVVLHFESVSGTCSLDLTTAA